MNENKVVQEENNNSLVELLIIIVFIVSMIGGGLKLYKNIQSMRPNNQLSGSCGLAGMSESERIKCLENENVEDKKTQNAKVFLLENKSIFITVGVVCLLSSIIVIGKAKKIKLKGSYVALGVFSIIFSIILLL